MRVMPETKTGEMIFTSVYRHSLDGKRRIPVPYRWRPKDPIDFSLMLFLEPDVGYYLRVLPPLQWTKLLEEINAMPSDHEQKPILQRLVGRHSIEVRLDSAGRITIPEEMAAEADITNMAVLAGSLRHFEIWSPARYASMEEKDKPEQVHVLKRVRAL
jgi:division/cell wall cluster transcriptional repressor MraZ